MTPQLPLALRFPPDQRLDAFVGQADVRALVEQSARGEREDWLYLAGPAGSGKTHLLLAACAEAQQRGETSAYLPLATMAGRLGDALVGAERSALVCLDSLEAIAGHRGDEEALFHFHNRARAADCRVIYAAQAMPSALPLSLPDLRSRLEQCTRLSLDALDESGRRLVLRRRAERRGLELDDAVLDFLFRRVGRDLGGLTALLDRLDRESLAAQRRITVPFLKRFVTETP
ncbi:DnaA regulatory inactivator Hda [Arenimonas sp.]|uniref:DnaA regulatory inactivator Hda n=1 Tax=Arenimonas sp. TaxID=1872635 RepID=UPI0039E3D54F